MQVKNNNFQQIVKNLNSRKEWPALALIKNDPVTPAVISKLIKSKDFSKTINLKDTKSFNNITNNNFEAISENISKKIADVEYVKDLFPDIELAQQILISSILSPKDMMSTNVLYKLKDTIMSPDLSSRLLDEIKEYCERNYSLSELLPDILLETLFETGAYVKAVLPESSIDELINYKSSSISTESLVENNFLNKNMTVKNIGLLGSPFEKKKARFSIESFSYKGDYDPYIRTTEGDHLPNDFAKLVEITDNLDVLKLPSVLLHNQKLTVEKCIKRKARISTEDIASINKDKPDEETGYTDQDIVDLVYKENGNTVEPFMYVNNRSQTRRKSIGKPLLLKLPTESVIPVHVPGDPGTHIGYFVLIDEDGNPLSYNDNKNYLENISTYTTSNNSLSSYLMQKAKNNLIGNDRMRGDIIEQQASIYSNIVETDLIERLKRGAYNRKLAIGKVEEVYRIMLARSLANRGTKLLFMPIEVVSYFANDYCKNGTGKSLMDNMKILTSLRAILLFAKVMAMTKSSISRTKVNLNIDPEDPDPQKTIEESIHEIIKMRQQYFPLGINSPVDICEWIQRAGLEFTFEGHPGIPETKFEFENSNFDHQIPDSEIDETLRKWTFMAMGLSPEIVDKGFEAEFATTVVINNLLLSKRVAQIQKRFTRQLSEFLQKILLNDAYIQNIVMDILKENKNAILKYAQDDEVELYKNNPSEFFIKYYNLFVENIQTDLPRPDASALKAQAEEFNTYCENLEKALDAWINSEFITSDTMGNIGSRMDEIKSAFKFYFQREWMAKNGFMTELSDITATDEDGNAKINLFSILKDHNQALIKSSVQFIQELNPTKRASDKDLENIEKEGEDGESPSDEYGSYSSNETDEDKGDKGDEDSGGGGDDFDFGDLKF